MKNSIFSLAAAVALTFSFPVDAGSKLDDVVVTGFKNPEALAVDPRTGSLYISVVGEMNGKDGDGYIARTDLNTLKPVKFIDGLNGPKGSQIVAGQMYVVEANAVLKINLASKATKTVELPQAGFLLDLAVNDGGEVFVTDPPNNSIYKISDGEVSTFIQHEKLSFPNGIEVMSNGDLLVASWGVVTDPNTWETSEAGRIIRVSTDGEILSRTEPLANLDGIERANGRYIATGFNDGVLYSFDPSTNEVSRTAHRKEGLADVAYYGNMLYTINFNTSELKMHQTK